MVRLRGSNSPGAGEDGREGHFHLVLLEGGGGQSWSRRLTPDFHTPQFLNRRFSFSPDSWLFQKVNTRRMVAGRCGWERLSSFSAAR